MNKNIEAICVINQNNITGTILFTENLKEKKTDIHINLKGLTPGLHGFHIHESGDLREGCKSCCSHYNPNNTEHGDLYGGHAGDLGNLKTDNNGIEQWSKTYNGNGFNGSSGFEVKQTVDGGFIIVGVTSNSFSLASPEIYLIKTDGNGNITSTFNIPTPNPNRKIESIVDILGRETKPKSNTPFIEIYDDGSIEKKLIVE